MESLSKLWLSKQNADIFSQGNSDWDNTERAISNAKNDTKLISHDWGGGTQLFEDELLQSKEFNFIFYRFGWSNGLVRLTAHVDLKEVYKSHWLSPSDELMKAFFAELHFDLLLIDFMHPISELLNFIKNLNKPIVYAMHDHHAVSYDIENDMHLGCNSFTASGASSALTVDSHNQIIQFDQKAIRYRWDFAELLRRCIFVLTPSLRNKQLLKPYYPEISIFSAPNRPTLVSPADIFVRRPEEAASVAIIQTKGSEQVDEPLRRKNLKLLASKLLKLDSPGVHTHDDT